LNGDEYRQRWSLRNDHPLTAPAYSEHRSMLAKELGLGRKSMPAAASAPSGTCCGKCRRASRDEPQTEADPSLQIEVRCDRISRRAEGETEATAFSGGPGTI
jgi:hypothetical protein